METSQPIELGDRGTPPGFFLSPMLFYLALLLPAILDTIEGIGHAIYADITTWTSKTGSDGWIEEALQHAATVVHEYAQSCGLSCSPQKSELLVITPSRKKSERPITLTIDGIDNKPTNQVRILGLLVQENGKAGAAIAKLKTTSDQIIHMIRRVTNRPR